ncbi:MAG: hypothetical protein HFJ37_05115 [Clostridia bacterium]|nr:hypothetical protein [Clostridia bacterium]
MKFFTNKNIWTKIIIVLIFVILFEFVVAKPSLGSTSDVLEFGGKLIQPFVSLLVTVGDAFVELMHSSIMGAEESLLHADLNSTFWETVGNILGFIVFGLVGISLFWFLGVGIVASAVVGFFAKSMFKSVWGYIGDKVGQGSISSFAEENMPDDLYLPVYSISPEEIFQGKILLFNIDFFNKGKEILEEKDEEGNLKYYYYYNDKGEKVITSPQNMGQQLKATISQWYVSLRNIALVCMMIVLLYIGIRMLLSTLASDKAKYKQMLQDWFMGLIILFFMHYIMAFSVTIVSKLTTIVSTSVEKSNYFINMADTDNGKLSEFVEEVGMGDLIQKGVWPSTGEEGTIICWPTNLMGSLRLKAQLANWGSDYIGYAFCFLILVFYTVFFVFTYLRRVLYMAFLTLMAPLVAVTYPIDKVTDGQAQGFNKWFKEYIFNLLIQPMHLLLYYILVTSAFKLAATNLIYSIIAIGFMIPAEKLLRGFFGFEKASTPGLLSSAAGGALAMNAINKLGGLGRKKGEGKDKDTSPEEEARKPKFKEPELEGEDEEIIRSHDDNPQEQQRKQQQREQEAQERAAKKQAQQSQKAAGKTGTTRDGSTNKSQPNTPSGDIRRFTLRDKMKRRAHARTRETKARMIRGIKKLPGNSIRFAGRFAGAATLGAAGLVAGIATGSPSKAFSNALAGGAAGYGVGGNVGGRVADFIENTIPTLKDYQDPKEVYNQVYNGRQYEEQVKQEYLKSIKKNNKGKLERNFDKNKVDEMLKDGGNFETLVKSGVDNIDDIIAAQKMINNGDVSNLKQARTIAKYAKRVGSDYDTSKTKDWIDKIAEENRERLGVSKKDSVLMAKKTMSKIEKFNKYKKNNY